MLLFRKKLTFLGHKMVEKNHFLSDSFTHKQGTYVDRHYLYHIF